MMNSPIPVDIQRNPECLVWNGKSIQLQSLATSIPPQLWSPLEVNCVKWNVDASVHNPDSCSAIGGVLRNHLGNFICLFSSPIPFMEINCAEVLAIQRAIAISLSSDTSKNCKIILESDSLNVVSWCNNASDGVWNLNYHLNFIINECKISLNILISHKSRTTNFVADSFAKQGLPRYSEFIAWL